MADEKRFSHITVNAGEDDDVVIQAGAYAPAGPAPTQTWDEPQVDQAQGQGEDAEAPAFETPHPQHAYQPAEQNVEEAAPAHHAQHAKRDERNEFEQTLEDLDAGPMSKMQKTVLVCVALFIVGFAVYYCMFMR